METDRENKSVPADFSEPVVLGASGLTTPRMGIGSDSGVPCEALEWAFERGINYFYWGSRRTKGMKEAIQKLAPRSREKMIIVLQTYDYTGLALEQTFLRGLKQLKIEYADAFILGMRNKPVPPRIMDKALALKDKGLVKHLIVSSHTRPTYKAHMERNVFDLIMVRYNAAHRGADKEVFPFLPKENPPGVICYNSTRWGNLFDPQWMPEGERTPSPVDLYRYVLSNPNIQMVLTAPETFEQLKENVKTLESGPVTDEEREWLERIGNHVYPLSPSTTFDFLVPSRGLKKK